MTGYKVHATKYLSGFEAPNRAGRVYARRADQIWIDFVPIEGSQRCAEVRVFVVV